MAPTTTSDDALEVPPLEPVAEPKSLSQQVYETLREAITNGQLAPGARLIERKLALDLRVSHIPVREALLRLADEGLVERDGRRGSRVATLSATELDEIQSLRVLLEEFVVARVQERWTEEAEVRLRRIVDEMQAAAAGGDTDAVLACDRAFHELLWNLADHRTLLELAAKLRSRINGFLRAATSALPPDELEVHAASHGELLEAIASGSSRRAKRAMAQHITIAADRVRASIARAA